MTSIRMTILVLGAVAFSWAVLAQSPMREGRWEITMQMEMPNMPVKMPPMKNTRCITKEELKDPGSTVPTGPPNQNNDCKVSDYKVDGNKVSWKVACTGAEKMTGTGEMSFQGDSYDGVMKMSTTSGEMTMKYVGKRVGDCTK